MNGKTRELKLKRNQAIVSDFDNMYKSGMRSGVIISALSEKYYLSFSTIRNIVYSSKSASELMYNDKKVPSAT